MNTKDIILIDCIRKHEKGVGLKQIVQETALPQTTVHRNLQTLVEIRILYKDQEKYYLGPVMLRWLNQESKGSYYVHIIHPFLLSLAENTGETVHLVQREGRYGFYIDKVEGAGPIALKSQVGKRLELYPTGAGRALLSLFNQRELEQYWQQTELRRLTPHTETDRATLQAQILHFHQQGYSSELQQNELNVQCIGVPLVFGRIQLAISITATTLLPGEELLAMSGILVDSAHKIQAILAAAADVSTASRTKG